MWTSTTFNANGTVSVSKIDQILMKFVLLSIYYLFVWNSLIIIHLRHTDFRTEEPSVFLISFNDNISIVDGSLWWILNQTSNSISMENLDCFVSCFKWKIFLYFIEFQSMNRHIMPISVESTIWLLNIYQMLWQWFEV